MRWNVDTDYMLKHLRAYLVFQLGQGYESGDVREALLKYGYDLTLVEKVVKSVDAKQFQPSKTKPSLKELNEDLYVYIQNLLVDYIKKEQDQGYELEIIEKALIKYGHHPVMVKKAKKTIDKGMVEDKYPSFGLSAGLMLFVTVLLILVFMFFLLTMTNADVTIVLLSFSPALISVIISYLVALSDAKKEIVRLMPIVAVALTVGLFIAGLQVSPDLRKISEPSVILILNALIAFVGSIMICVFSKRTEKITKESIENS